ncbi:replication protein RepA [Thalassotalea sp. LPB0316]|uniref:replication protein RepA n=1 Tax=Thalassotalea sp. LPB0316 TaxID=2769490 RepID=UPI001866EF51|nr:replication protein RepA [Thalassotalea sp. LPB0316]QOL26463.1 replication protein RepA [Thalassotalea sp. LPB0316]
MSLTDLKKVNTGKKQKRKKVSVDAFINDAVNYAKGKPKVVSARPSQSTVNQEKVAKKNYKHATFTLNQQAIDTLQLLADETDLAKSHILRILLGSDPDEALKQRLLSIIDKKADQ